MDFSPALKQKHFFRFTGPPEHWLTAFKFMTWGLEAKHQESWKKIETGDVFFIHSTGYPRSAFRNAKSGIIGIGVVGFDFSIKKNFLWHYEFKNQENKWPLLVPLTEVYLFGDIPDPTTWENPEPNNNDKTKHLIDKMLQNLVPISEIKGFPPMGSFSSVSMEVAEQILEKNRKLLLYTGHSTRGIIKNEEKPSDLVRVNNATETLRSAATLRFLESINKRLIIKPYSLTQRDNNILARAEESHFTVLQELIVLFKRKGYDTFSNKHVDLFAHNGDRSFLFEVKSTENRNFRVQARKGIIQLYEYDYFEISKFKREKNIDFEDQYKVLVPSKEPTDKKYLEFINALDLGVATVSNGALKPSGQDFGFSKI